MLIGTIEFEDDLFLGPYENRYIPLDETGFIKLAIQLANSKYNWKNEIETPTEEDVVTELQEKVDVLEKILSVALARGSESPNLNLAQFAEISRMYLEISVTVGGLKDNFIAKNRSPSPGANAFSGPNLFESHSPFYKNWGKMKFDTSLCYSPLALKVLTDDPVRSHKQVYIKKLIELQAGVLRHPSISCINSVDFKTLVDVLGDDGLSKWSTSMEGALASSFSKLVNNSAGYVDGILGDYEDYMQSGGNISKDDFLLKMRNHSELKKYLKQPSLLNRFASSCVAAFYSVASFFGFLKVEAEHYNDPNRFERTKEGNFVNPLTGESALQRILSLSVEFAEWRNTNEHFQAISESLGGGGAAASAVEPTRRARAQQFHSSAQAASAAEGGAAPSAPESVVAAERRSGVPKQR